MSGAPRFVPHYTVEQYRQWKGRWQLIDGVPIAMTPSPFGNHERIVSRLARMLGNQIEANGCACEVYTNLDWIVSDDTVVRPDVMVVCGEQPSHHLERPPAFAAEVLSESTRHQDLTVKRELYQDHGVPHCLIIDPDQRVVHWMRAGEAEVTLSEEHSDLSLTLENQCSVHIECHRLFDKR